MNTYDEMSERKKREEKLQDQDVLDEGQKANLDYHPKAGTSEGLTELEHPDTQKNDEDFVDTTKTDYQS